MEALWTFVSRLLLAALAAASLFSSAAAWFVLEGSVATLARETFASPSGASDSTGAPRMLRVCSVGAAQSECRYDRLQDALDAALPGDQVILAPGIYGEGATISTPGLVLRGEPGAHLRGHAVEGKAALVVKAAGVLIEGIECSGIAVRDNNGACIRIEGDDLTVRDVYFHDNQQGILSGPGGGVLLVEDSLFERNGFGGQAHGVYVGRPVETFVFRNNRVLATTGAGHGLKSRAHRTIVEGSIIAGLDGQDSRAIDLPEGGQVEIRNNVLQKGPNSDNAQMIGLALEGPLHQANETLIEGNLLLFDTLPTGIVQSLGRALGLMPARGHGNPQRIPGASGPAQQRDRGRTRDRPGRHRGRQSQLPKQTGGRPAAISGAARGS